jgi:hypothetical protein
MGRTLLDDLVKMLLKVNCFFERKCASIRRQVDDNFDSIIVNVMRSCTSWEEFLVGGVICGLIWVYWLAVSNSFWILELDRCPD